MEAASRHAGVAAAEQAAAMMTAVGMPRMPARAMMALVASPDEGYTAAELAERLGVSAAAVSGAVRYLQSLHLVQRISRSGDRRDRYDLADEAWADLMTADAPMYARLADLTRQIADANAVATASARRARAGADFLAFLGERMPALVDEWRAQRSQGA